MFANFTNTVVAKRDILTVADRDSSQANWIAKCDSSASKRFAFRQRN